MKKVVVSALLACMLAFSMTGCGGETEESSAVETTEVVSEETGATETKQVTTKEAAGIIYIGTDGNMKEYECQASKNITPEVMISTMATMTGWNLDLAGSVIANEDGMTVCFASTSSIFTGVPKEQDEEFAVSDKEQLVATILDSIQYTLQQNFVDVEAGEDPSSLNIYYCMEGEQPLDLSDINKTVPMDQPYTGLTEGTSEN
ncbi:MAG: hypothetical protein IJA36_01065 [Lachnospiraceae bacterium]|nr:hypothetical protein [Lachnospiraceae bacterium]